MTVKERVIEKLHPSRLRVSGKFHAILSCLLGQSGWTNPELAGVTVTSDGFLLGMQQGDIGYNEFIGSKADLDRNLDGVAKAAGLTKQERAYLMGLSPQP